MARKLQKLINYHTSGVSMPESGKVELGEIVVRHNDEQPELLIKKNNGEFATFVDSNAVDLKVNTETTRAEGAEEALSDRIDSLSGSSHSHDNKGVLDGITSKKVTAWDDAAAKRHEHTNKTVLDGISSEKVDAWDAAEQNAKDYADGLASNYDAAGAAATAEQNAKDYADSLASNYDAAGAAATAEQNAKDYADSLASNYDAAGAAAQALADAKTDAEAKYQVKGDYEAAGAEGRAKDYTNAEIAKLDKVYAAKSVVDTLVGSDTNKSVRTVAVEEVAKVVNGAPESYNTLKEIADWIQNDTTGAAEMANDIKALKAVSADTRLEALEADSHTHNNKTVLDGISSEKVAAWDAAEKNAKDYADTQVASAKSILDKAVEDVDGKFASYATSADTVAAINAVDGKFADYATSADTVVAINAVAGRVADLEALSGATQSAIQEIKVSGITGVDVVENGTTRTLDFTEMVIDCGDF